MNFSSNGKERKTFNDINITPLTDIFLVLLIIMMVIAPSFQSVDNNISMPNINSSSTSTVVGQKTCSTCRGKGWIAGFSTPNYGASGQRWCDACQELVNPSHSHDRCPSCRGTGSQPTINVK
jgi:uncharacterized paraquat-inducible protein A